MDAIEQTGRNVEDAVEAALKALGASRDEVDVEVLAEETRGLLGIFGSSSARVRVTRKGRAAEAASPTPEPVALPQHDPEQEPTAEPERPALPRVEGERSVLAMRAVEVTEQVVGMMGLSARVEIIEDGPEGVSLDIRSEDDLGLLIGKHGQTLGSLQLIVAMMANRGVPEEERRRVVLDAAGYRARRERTLRDIAASAAERAKRSGRPVTLTALNPHERRIVHMALADDPAVTTRSEGEDPDRSVVISPSRSRTRRPGS